MTKTHTTIVTAADLRAALAGVPDERRVVVMRNGELVPCELLVTACGDWCVVEVCEDEREDALNRL